MPRNSLSDLDIERTREFLCTAALELYRAEGEAAITFRRLAEQTGTSHTHAYRYFRNKEELFAAMRLRCYQRFADAILQADRPEDSAARRLAAAYGGVMAFVEASPEQFALMFSTTQPPLESYPSLLAVRRASFDHLVGIVQQAVDAGQIEGDARDIMHVGWGAVHGLVNLHLAGQLVHGRGIETLTGTLLKQVFQPLFDHSDPKLTHKTAKKA